MELSFFASSFEMGSPIASVGAWASERYRTWFGREEEQTADADREDRTREVAQRSA